MLFQDRKRKVLLPEEVGEKGFLESRFPAFRIDSSGKGMQRTGFEGPDWQVAEGHKRALWMWHRSRAQILDWASSTPPFIPLVS
ncbi:hypothetical protein TNCV_3501632 [Trichonephila clavipes]|uniref:Uncharacterized protein n=1 Tax=Trichonephila clavipes TaxID=2585209 RepID=A0A8X6RY30_TRICX|nr:hypothetical protein TNCV_3501632 [Trichonephila clavipes]